MHDPRLDRLADVVTGYCTRVRTGDLVTIVGEPGCMNAVEAMFASIIRAGGHPSFHPKCESLQELVLRLGSNEQIAHVSPFEEHRLRHADVLIVLNHPVNTRAMEGVPHERMTMWQRARRELLTMSLQRKAQGQVRYCLTEVPGQAAAQDAGMSLRAYSDAVFGAGMLDQRDPVAAWRELDERQNRMIDFLHGVRTLRMTAPPPLERARRNSNDGTHLTIDVSGMTWGSCAGGDNFPDGEVYTGPRAVDGVVNFTLPSCFRGCEVEGVRLVLKDGLVTEASAERGEDHLHAMLSIDDGARRIGELGLGTNFALRRGLRNAFFDEKIGGTFHLALGAAYPETGLVNESALHWDLVCDLRHGGIIEADDRPILRGGQYLEKGWPGTA